uniref:Cysteine protease n=1 Tax=Nothobranchius furzeri TaxID=105023 RepID=A0A8C6NV12_NOTFU
HESIKFEDFPETPEPVWILGKEYSALTEKDEILSDVTTRLWFTYRKNFPPIGGTGPTSDTGWGCMLRCGQMILGEALVCRHLGRDWRWAKGRKQREEYVSILNAFIDKKDSYYSIHQIAQMGVGEGKPIGQWYGPNTVAQVLKKLAVFDTWSRLVVHVAMDNTVIIEEISECSCDATWMVELFCCFKYHSRTGVPTALWKPLVLLIPLRLGLSDINEAYIDTLKQCFMLPQSLGVIGGKPNSAHYFIGYVGEELIYLDPHTTQPAVEPCEDGQVPDETYHCQHPPCRMHICELDPSIAVGFFCRTEDEFDDWCMRIRRVCLCWGLPMFELVDSQPAHMVSIDALNLTPDFSDSDRLERFFDSEDEEFEILSL